MSGVTPRAAAAGDREALAVLIGELLAAHRTATPAGLAAARRLGCRYIEWTVAEDNAAAVAFHAAAGAAPLAGKAIHRIDGPALERLAGEDREIREPC